MKGIIITDKGLEKTASLEIFEKIKSKSEEQAQSNKVASAPEGEPLSETVVLFPLKKEEDLCRLCYSAQSVRRVMKLLFEFKVDMNLEKSVEEFKGKLSKQKFDYKQIKVECERIGEHDFNSVDFAKEASKELRDSGLEIDWKEHNAILYIYIYNNQGYFCVDFSGRELDKREYRIFVRPASLKGTIAYALLRFSGYKAGETLVDPMSESGITIIEAAIFAGKKPVHYYKKEFAFTKIDSEWKKVFDEEDSKEVKKVKNLYAYDKHLRNISDNKKNAKIAGVDKIINFSKTEVEWLDTKFEKNSIDKIIIKLPSESKRIDKKTVEKMYDELFYQAEFVLKKKGSITVCSGKNELLKERALKKKFKVVEEQVVYSGQQKHLFTKFQLK